MLTNDIIESLNLAAATSKPPSTLLIEQVGDALRERDALKDAVRLAFQWSNHGHCPECGKFYESGTHEPDCKLGKLINQDELYDKMVCKFSEENQQLRAALQNLIVDYSQPTEGGYIINGAPVEIIEEALEES